MSTQSPLTPVGTDFSLTNTYFFALRKDGELAVYWHYTQGDRVITMYVAVAREVRPGVFHRDNNLDGPSRFPRSYASAYDALKGMVKPRFQDKLFTFGQSALPEKFQRQLAA